MTNDFGYLLLFVIGALGFIGAVLFAARLLRPNRPNVEKNSTYESGEAPVGNAGVQFNIRFYVIALVFVLFEVELVFLFPWATVFGQATLIHQTNGQWGWFALGEITLFVSLLALGLGYVWAKGYLDWLKPEPTQPTVQSPVPPDLYRRVNQKYRPTNLVLLLAIGLATTTASAQDTTIVARRELNFYRAQVISADGYTTNSILYEVTDSTLRLAPNNAQTVARIKAGYLLLLGEIENRGIVRVSLRRKGNGVWGLVGGAGVGLIGALTSGGSGSYGSELYTFGLIFTSTLGAGLGALVSAFPRYSRKIDRSPTLFRQAVPALRRFSIVGQRQ